MNRFLLALALSGCGGTVCGAGTHESEGVCLPDPVAAPAAPSLTVPEVFAAPIDPPGTGPELGPTLRIELDAAGTMHIDGEAVSDEALADRVAAYRGMLNDPASASAQIVASPDAPHERVVAIMTRLNGDGVSRFSFETSAPDAP